MGVNFSPIPAARAVGESTTTIGASVAAVQYAPNTGRISGYIKNTSNRTMWVKFGPAGPTPPNGILPSTLPLVAAVPFNDVPPGSNIDIQGGYDQEISLIWEGSNPKGGAIIHEMIG